MSVTPSQKHSIRSKRKPLTFLAGVTLTSMLVFIGVAVSLGEKHVLRDKMPSHHIHKLNSSGHFDRRTEKLKTLIAVKLERLTEGPVVKDKPFLLEATISARKPLPNVKIRWKVPEGVVALGAPLEQTLEKLLPGQDVKLQMEFVSHTEENKAVFIHVESADSAAPVGNSAQYNTYWEEQLREQSAALKKNLEN